MHSSTYKSVLKPCLPGMDGSLTIIGRRFLPRCGTVWRVRSYVPSIPSHPKLTNQMVFIVITISITTQSTSKTDLHQFNLKWFQRCYDQNLCGLSLYNFLL